MPDQEEYYQIEIQTKVYDDLGNPGPWSVFKAWEAHQYNSAVREEALRTYMNLKQQYAEAMNAIHDRNSLTKCDVDVRLVYMKHTVLAQFTPTFFEIS